MSALGALNLDSTLGVCVCFLAHYSGQVVLITFLAKPALVPKIV